MIVRITGGLGNQMFQYAFKKTLDSKQEVNYIDTRFYEHKDIHNGYQLKEVFSITDKSYDGKICAPSQVHPLLYKVLYRLGKKMLKTSNYLMEIIIDYYKDIDQIQGEYFYLDGYWQSESYFKQCEMTIRECFTFKDFTEEKNIELYQLMLDRECVAVHIRRGDFLSNSKFVCLGTTDYYEKAIAYIKEYVTNPYFIILSDDINWCKKEFDLGEEVTYVDWNHGQKSYRDMQIMSLCKHNIIANSSFSWWGGWLNQNQHKIVVAPYKFYSGNKRNEEFLLPREWVKIEYKQILR